MRRSLIISTAVILVLVDRILKILTLKGLLLGSFWFFGYPRFAFHKNFGLAFDLPLSRILIILFSFLSIILLVALIITSIKKSQNYIFGLILIIVGALENLIDRIHYGFVIDVIELFPGSIWNIADLTILLGIFLIITQKHKKTLPV